MGLFLHPFVVHCAGGGSLLTTVPGEENTAGGGGGYCVVRGVTILTVRYTVSFTPAVPVPPQHSLLKCLHLRSTFTPATACNRK